MSISNRNGKRERVERGLYIKRGIYQACATDASGKMVWKSLGAVSLSQARRMRDKFAGEARGIVVNTTKATMGHVADEWLAQQEHLRALGEVRPGTVRNHEEAWRLHIAPTFDRRQVQSITPDDLVAWHHARIKEGYADWTIRRHWITLRSILGYAARKGYAPANVADSLSRRERPKNGKSQVRYLEEEEIATLLNHAPERYRLAMMLMVFCGLRISELLAVRWRDVSMSEGIVRVTGQIERVKGQGVARVDYPKTDAGNREIVLMDGLSKALAAGKLSSKFSRPDDYVLASEVGTPMEVRNVRGRGIQEAAKAAGLEAVTCHVLRHTFASVLIAQGGDVLFVAGQMGHAKPSVTLDTYGHLFDRARHADSHREAMQSQFGHMVEPTNLTAT